MYIYPIGQTPACLHASRRLKASSLRLIDHPAPDVTHLLLDVPSFHADGQLRCGGFIEELLPMLPPSITIIGGNLDVPSLDSYRKADLLANPLYLAKNAAITADCAIRTVGEKMTFIFSGCEALVIGWGRIGKCLAATLRKLGCGVTVAARKESDRALLAALSYHAVSIEEIPSQLDRFHLLFNTVPHPVLETDVPDRCIAIELASVPGITGSHIIDGRGLPGKMAPESSGELIAESTLSILQEDLI